MAETAPAAGARALPAALAWPCLAAAAALSVLVQGFQLPGATNAWHLPVLLDWIGSAEGPDDAFTRSLERFATQVWPTLALVADERNWPWLLAAAHFAARVATLAGLYLLLARLTVGAGGDRSRPALAVACLLGVGLAFFRQSPLGGGEVLLDEFSHSTLNVPLALFLFLAAAERRWWPAGALLGILFDVNAFVGLWAGLATAAAFLAVERGLHRRPWSALARLAAGPLALALLLALPTLRDLAAAIAAADAPPGFDARDFLRAFYGGHFFVDSVPAGSLLTALLLLLGLAWSARQLRLREAVSRDARCALGGILAALLAVVAAGAALPYLSGSALLLNLHPMRMDFLLVWWFYLALGCLLVARDRLDLPAALVLLALFAGLFLPLLLLLPLLDERAAPARRWLRPLAFALVAAGLLLGDDLPSLPFATHRWVQAIQLALLLALLLPAVRRRQVDAGTAAIAALLALLSCHLAAPYLPGRPWIAAALLLLAAALPLAPQSRASQSGQPGPWTLQPPGRLPAALLLAGALTALLPGARHLAESGRLDRYDARSLSFLAAQRWAREATPPGSLFLAPDWQLEGNLTPSFWTLSRRPVWVDWRQGAAVHWAPAFYPQWRERMDRVRALDTVEEKLAFARAAGIAYVILGPDEPRPAAAPALFDDGVTAVLPAGAAR